MARNRIRRSNTIQSRQLLLWFSAGVALTIFLLLMVYMKVRNTALAEEVKKIEVELAEVQRRNQLVIMEIDREKTPAALQRKNREFGLQLITTDDPTIVKIQADLPVTPGAGRMLVRTETQR
jgi:hypothetical protein